MKTKSPVCGMFCEILVIITMNSLRRSPLFKHRTQQCLAEETFIGSLLPSQRFVDKTSRRSLKDRPVFPGDACLTPNRGCAASPNLFRCNTRDSLSEGGGRDNETERGGGGRGGSQNRFGPHNYTAAGWRSVVWSHGCGSLQQTPQAISNSSIAPWNILC